MTTVVRMFGGVDIDLLNPDLSKISIGSIFRTLSIMPRYNGQTRRFYSNLEHSFHGAIEFASLGQVQQARAFLIHDAHEALIGDITVPTAVAAGIQPQLTELKSRIDAAMSKRFKCDLELYQRDIKEMDIALFHREWADLMQWGDPELPIKARSNRRYLPSPINKVTVPDRDALLHNTMTMWKRWSK